MKAVLFVLLVALASSISPSIEKCFQAAKLLEVSVFNALAARDLDLIIDDLEKIFESSPSVLDTCGAQNEAQKMRNTYPPVCTQILAKQAKLFVKIMRLYAEDKVKNQKAILLYTTMFETIFKTQVQKKCSFLAHHNIMQIKNKGQCAEGLYQLSLVFETLDIALMDGKFNESLTNAGKVIQQLPATLDSCGQSDMANIIRKDLPKECLRAIGGFVRELATLEENYSHLQWLQKHFKDFTQAIVKVKDACPALEN